MNRFAKSVNFENLLELNYTLLPKEYLVIMDFSASVQIYKNYGGQKIFVLRVQTKLIHLVFRLLFSRV
jgi:hypothetical protein